MRKDFVITRRSTGPVNDADRRDYLAQGEISAYPGAMAIWKEIVDHCEKRCPDALWPFKSNAGEIEDIRWNADHDGGSENAELIRQCEAEIMVAARCLVSIQESKNLAERFRMQ